MIKTLYHTSEHEVQLATRDVAETPAPERQIHTKSTSPIYSNPYNGANRTYDGNPTSLQSQLGSSNFILSFPPIISHHLLLSDLPYARPSTYEPKRPHH